MKAFSRLGRFTRLAAAGLLLVLAGVSLWAAQARLSINADLASYLPEDDPVLAGGRLIFRHHPALDTLALDISQPEGKHDPALLVRAGDLAARRLKESGLFRQVGLGGARRALPQLYSLAMDNLPEMFDARELREEVAPLLEPDKVRRALAASLERLSLSAGPGEDLAADPLGLAGLVMARLSRSLAPGEAEMVGGHLVSAGGRHLLLLAQPKLPGADTGQAREITAVLDRLAAEVKTLSPGGDGLALSPVGTYRAALDNETLIRHDTTLALGLATGGILLLLALCFPRPWMGLLAMVPALAGASMGLLAYSFFRSSISGMALGFGGAIISIGVDSGICYLMYLDRGRGGGAGETFREVWPVELFTLLTTVNAFAAMLFSDFGVLWEVGLFAALGVFFSSIFTHIFFPLLFPRLEPSPRRSALPLDRLLDRLTLNRGWTAFGICAVLGVFLAFFAWPDFRGDLKAMSTVTPATQATEDQVGRVWGSVFDKSYLLARAADEKSLWREADRLAGFLEGERRAGRLAGGLPAALAFPGPERQAANLRAWREFWTPERREALEASLNRAGLDLGFAPGAFAPFLARVEHPEPHAFQPPREAAELLGAARERDGEGWLLMGTITPAPGAAAWLAERAGAQGFAAYDAGVYGERLGSLLAKAFAWILGVMGFCLVAILYVLFLDWALVALTLLPLVFALAATLGTLGLLGRGVDIPGLMLAVLVLGLGTDYAVFMVRARQRFQDPAHPDIKPFAASAFLAAGATVLGVGALAFARHAVLQSAGLSLTLAIGYTLLGTFAFLPPLLDRLFRPTPFPGDPGLAPGSAAHRRLVQRRFRHLDAHTRIFAAMKMRTDPMFPALAGLVPLRGPILDLGTGMGIPASWLAAVRPGLSFLGLEPDPARARTASWVLDGRGRVETGAAPDLPGGEGNPGGFRAATLLDMAHYLDDAELALTLQRVAGRLEEGGRLILRTALPGPGRPPLFRRMEDFRLRLAGSRAHWRTGGQMEAALAAAGFRLLESFPTAPGREETWFLARRESAAAPVGEAEEGA